MPVWMMWTLGIAGVFLAWEPLWSLLGGGSVSVSHLRRWRQNGRVFLLDVRTGPEFSWRHIPGAIHRPDLLWGSRALPLPKDRPVVVVCLTGHRSPVVAWRLRRAGFENAFSLHGGMVAWLLAPGNKEERQ
ncbi:Rhodanese domain protein [Desulfohalobium retbaense DSM 5692]|uniref:Rhodanese domain protein n=2 Tax=Desulfohalobium TaxID=45662 RepID=C8X5R9_DESRD|nr:Rhodanese domain protein [Desulfohalobium retbaense DSM 5692]